MKRLFFASINKDEMAASLGRYFTDADVAAWTRGFMLGLHGGQPPEHAPEPTLEGASIGRSAYVRAAERLKIAQEAGKKSADVRKEAYGTAQPEGASKVLRATLEHKPEPTPEQSVIRDPLSKEQETHESINPPKKPRRKFSPVVDNPPSIEEIQAYVDEVGGLIPAEEFFYANERSAWTYAKGTQQVLNWKGHYMNWNRRRIAEQPPEPQAPIQIPPDPWAIKADIILKRFTEAEIVEFLGLTKTPPSMRRHLMESRTHIQRIIDGKMNGQCP